MKILAIDYGQKRLGFAISDPSETIASAIACLEKGKGRDELDCVAQLVERNGAEEVVVGLPKNMDNTVGETGQLALDFATRLRDRLQVPVATWDERLTTVQGERAMLEAGLTRRKRKARIDKIAAQLLLQNYLDARKSQKG